VHVPANAPPGATFNDTAAASGTYNGAPVSQTTTLPNTPTVAIPPINGCSLSSSNKAADHVGVMVGETFDYYIHVLNAGNQPCTSVSVSDTLNAKVTFVSCTSSCTNSGQNVTWDVGTVGPGSSLTLAVTVKVVAGATGTIPNTALIHQPGQPDIAVTTPGPTIGDSSVLAPPNPPGFPGGNGNGGNGGNGGNRLAYTGWNTPWMWLLVLAGLSWTGALLLSRSRRAG
jgi:uncharacterized repeat protein (TIGR01451 family)